VSRFHDRVSELLPLVKEFKDHQFTVLPQMLIQTILDIDLQFI